MHATARAAAAHGGTAVSVWVYTVGEKAGWVDDAWEAWIVAGVAVVVGLAFGPLAAIAIKAFEGGIPAGRRPRWGEAVCGGEDR